MNLTQFKRLNTLLGVLFGIIATMIYAITTESSASLWDCGEFIASAYKLQVVHPPGAPMFLMVGRMFSLLAGGNPEMVAKWLNFMSALCSGLAMMFLFWIVSHMARRLITDKLKDTEIPIDKVIAILGASGIAAMVGTFTDSIWFSAVEGEVYSMSLFCTSVVVWGIMKWDEHADESYADRWLLFIAFVMGCSIFVHWLNLLTIPALTFVYYFRRFTPTLKGVFVALASSIALLGLIYKGVITTLVAIASSFELAMVNGMGLPFNSGVVVFLLLFIGLYVFALKYTYEKNKIALYNFLCAFIFILLGYSTIVTSVIRSNAQPNIDMNSPRDIVSLASYLNREQYGTRPFLFGYDFTAKVVDTKKIGDKYARGKHGYDIVGEQNEYVYEGNKMLFPRIYDVAPEHRDNYECWLGLKKGEKPTYSDNIGFFLNYQIGHMYLRYLFWNFVGRQNDEQGGCGDLKNGNWISGINFIDGMRLGSQSNLPDAVAKHDARNTYYFIPLLLGILGLVYHFSTDKRRALVVLLLFFFCGVSIIIQGNSPPQEPRERDYIFAGSFYAFVIWIGLGVVALYDMIKGSKKESSIPAAFIAIAIASIAPALMGFYNWDDHDRSGRTSARDFAANYLNSCAPDAIIFTQGDNDTYPLWYAQEVENIRRDVRVVNLSLLGVDWYINQLRRRVNDAAPVPMTLDSTKIRGSKRDVVPFYEGASSGGGEMELTDLMKFIGDDKLSSIPQRPDLNYFPTQSLKLSVDTNALLKNGTIAPKFANQSVGQMQWDIQRRSLYKNDLMVLDIIAANALQGWKRPIYFATSVAPSSYMGLDRYLQLEGLAYRLVPVRAPEKQRNTPYVGTVNTEKMYDNLVNKFTFGNVEKEGIHIDSDTRRMIYTFRSSYSRLADALIMEGDTVKAGKVLDRCTELLPSRAAVYNLYTVPLVESYYQAHQYEKANKLAEEIAGNMKQDLDYINQLESNDKRMAKAFGRDKQVSEQLIKMMSDMAKQFGQTATAEKLNAYLKP